MKKYVSILLVALAFASCNQGVEPEITSDVTLEPIITRALALNFNTGNKIGVKMTMADGSVYAENAEFTYNGTIFTGTQKWYADGAQTCDILAYYPFQEEFPASFSVQADQSEGTDASDFMVASVKGVRPSSSPILVPFKHQFVQLDVVVNSDFDVEVEEVVLKNLNPTATVSVAEGVVSVAPDASASVIDIVPETITANRKYAAVVAPQDLKDMGLTVKIKNGATLVTMVDDQTLAAGFRYTISVTASADQVNAQISGQISDWQNGGNLDTDEPQVEKPVFEEFDGYFNYHGLRYNTAIINGKTWMTEPMAYVPEGVTVSSNPAAEDAAEAGIFYPYTVKDGAAVALTSDEGVKELGLLYRPETAYAATITQENCQTFEACQGICPDGWHIPTRAEYYALCGASNASVILGESSNQTNSSAFFWDATSGYATISKFDEAGFNYTMSGCMYNGKYQTLVVDSTVCALESYYGRLRMNYSLTSTARIKANNKSNPEFFVLMTIFTALNNLGKISLAQSDYSLVAASLRCVKD